MTPAHSRAERARGEGAGEGVADPEGQGQGGGGEEGEEAVDDHQVVVGQQIGGVAGRWGAVGVEQPAHVGVGEAPPGGAGAGAVRGVGIAGLVTEAVMAAVVGHPGDQRSLDGHRPGRRQTIFKTRLALKLRWVNNR